MNELWSCHAIDYNLEEIGGSSVKWNKSKVQRQIPHVLTNQCYIKLHEKGMEGVKTR